MLQEIVLTFKTIWRKILMYLQNKFFSNDKHNEDMINDLYYKDVLSNKDIKIIHSNYYERRKDNDDFENNVPNSKNYVIINN
jgi:hypothetical protein